MALVVDVLMCLMDQDRTGRNIDEGGVSMVVHLLHKLRDSSEHIPQ
jgi:hypothetical protein